MNVDAFNSLVRSRRSIFPRSYIDKPIPDEIIWDILENANWAPTHKLTEPWRFKVLKGEAKARLADFMAEKYKEITPAEQFLAKKYNKLQHKPRKAGCMIAICMQRDPEDRLPEWEELASVACAVQNMWLSCTAHGIGAYWSSPALIQYMDEFFDLAEGEKCLGFMYMGYYEGEGKTKREAITTKVEWLGA